jgi:hypothetical protein
MRKFNLVFSLMTISDGPWNLKVHCKYSDKLYIKFKHGDSGKPCYSY